MYVFVCVWLSERHGGWGEGATPARLRCNAPAQRSLHCNREQQTTNAKCSLSITHTHARQSVFVFGDETPYRRCDVKGVCCNHQRRVASRRRAAMSLTLVVAFAETLEDEHKLKYSIKK